MPFHSFLSDLLTHRIHRCKSLCVAITCYTVLIPGTAEQNATYGPGEGQQILSKPREQSGIIKANGIVLKSTRWASSLSGLNSISSPCDHIKTETIGHKESATRKVALLSLLPARTTLSYIETSPHRSPLGKFGSFNTHNTPWRPQGLQSLLHNVAGQKTLQVHLGAAIPQGEGQFDAL